MKKNLSEIAKLKEGYLNPSRKNKDYFYGGKNNWIRANDLNNSFLYETSEKISDSGLKTNSKYTENVFLKNSVCISKSGTIGKLAFLKINGFGNRAIININSHISITNKYLFYWLLKNKKKISGEANGAVQKNLYIKNLEKVVINLPNFSFQQQIIAKRRNDNMYSKIYYELILSFDNQKL